MEEKKTFLIVGLGNPGAEYEHTRHNAGFDAVDVLAEEMGCRYWKTEGGALTAKGKWRGEEVVLGIGRPPGRKPVVDWVLSQPRKDDAEAFEHAVAEGAAAVTFLIDNGLEKTQQRFN